MGSVALPAVLRAGGGGPGQFSTGTMQQAMYSQVTNQAHPAHTPVAVSVVHFILFFHHMPASIRL